MRKILFAACLIVAGVVWASSPQNVVRVFNQPQGGYFILDSNDEVVGFAEKGTLTKESENYKRISELSGMKVQIMDYSLSLEIATKYAIKDTIGPILGDIAFNQTAPYNNHCPQDPTTGRNCVTGCVATAMAMVMAYYQWPKVCTGGEVTYTSVKVVTDGGITKTIQINDVSYDYREHPFDWENILPRYAGVETTQAQKDAVADLMFACGVACQMGYSSFESGSNGDKALNAFIKYFNYNPNMKEEENKIRVPYSRKLKFN